MLICTLNRIDRSRSTIENKQVIVVEQELYIGLNPRQQWFIEQIKEYGEFSRAKFVAKFQNEVSEHQLYKDLRLLREFGIVKRERRRIRLGPSREPQINPML